MIVRNYTDGIDNDSKKIWDEHWSTKNTDQKLFGKISSFYRMNLISKLVGKYNDEYFPEKGLFLEAGSGTTESSNLILKKKRTFIACDISRLPLLRIENKSIDIRIQADIFRLPLSNNILDGIYNIGVMEHFSFQENIDLINEFKRILKPGGKMILYWPWKYCWVELVSKIRPLFPKSPSMFGDFDFINLIKIVGNLDIMAIEHSLKDLYIHKIIIIKKR